MRVELARHQNLVEHSLEKDNAPVTQKSLYKKLRKFFMDYSKLQRISRHERDSVYIPLYFGVSGRKVVISKRLIGEADHPLAEYSIRMTQNIVATDSERRVTRIWSFGEEGPIRKQLTKVITYSKGERLVSTDLSVADQVEEVPVLAALINGSIGI